LRGVVFALFSLGFDGREIGFSEALGIVQNREPERRPPTRFLWARPSWDEISGDFLRGSATRLSISPSNCILTAVLGLLIFSGDVVGASSAVEAEGPTGPIRASPARPILEGQLRHSVTPGLDCCAFQTIFVKRTGQRFMTVAVLGVP